MVQKARKRFAAHTAQIKLIKPEQIAIQKSFITDYEQRAQNLQNCKTVDPFNVSNQEVGEQA